MIKFALTTDLDGIADLGAFFFKEAQLPGEFNAEHWKATWKTLLIENIGTILLDTKDDQVIGAVGGIVAPDINTGDLIATESFWYVLKDHRGEGMKLFHSFVEEAQRRQCKRIVMAAVLHSPTFMSVNKFFIKTLAMRPLETHYVMEL